MSSYAVDVASTSIGRDSSHDLTLTDEVCSNNTYKVKKYDGRELTGEGCYFIKADRIEIKWNPPAEPSNEDVPTTEFVLMRHGDAFFKKLGVKANWRVFKI